MFRRRKRRPETELEPLLEAGRQWASDDDPVEDLAEREQVTHLRECFAELTHEHQAILVLRIVQGLSYEEISRTLNMPIGTVMSRLSRARAELKTRLKARSGDAT